MPDFTHVFDIDELGVRLGAETAPTRMPNGQTAVLPVWTPALAEALRAHIQSALDGAASPEVCHRGSAPLWVMGAALSAMYPASVSFAPPVPGVYLKLWNLTQGPLEPAAEVEFDTRRVGDVLYVSYKADDPAKPQLFGGGHHSYDPALIPRIRAPRAEGLHVCLSGNSSYNVTMSIATAYFTDCGSLSLKSPADGAYRCCFTRSPAVALGDPTPALPD